MLQRVLILLFFPFVLLGQNFPIAPTNYVTDDGQILSDTEEQALNLKLKQFEDSSSTQLFVYTAKSSKGKVMADLCQDIFHAWKIGQGKKNNGVLIAVFVDDHKFRIHTGYGMEGILPDLLTKKIQDEQMRPYFKQNMYYDGINAGVDQLIYWCKNEFTAADLETPANKVESLIFTILYSISLLLFISFSIIMYTKFLGEKSLKKVLWIVGIVAVFIPFVGLVILIILNIAAYKIGRMKTSGYGSKDYSNTDSSWGSSWSSSDSSSSDSSSSFDGGGGGDSGGGGSDSSW